MKMAMGRVSDAVRAAHFPLPVALTLDSTGTLGFFATNGKVAKMNGVALATPTFQHGSWGKRRLVLKPVFPRAALLLTF